MNTYEYWIPQALTLLLFLWSEYLGVSKQLKSNAIIELLMCAMSPKKIIPADPVELTPPAVVSVEPAPFPK